MGSYDPRTIAAAIEDLDRVLGPAGANTDPHGRIRLAVSQSMGLPPTHQTVSDVTREIAARMPRSPAAASGATAPRQERGPIKMPERFGKSGNMFGELKAYGIDTIFQGNFTAVANVWGTDIPAGAGIKVLQAGVVLIWDFTALSGDYNAVFIDEMTYNTEPYSVPRGSSINGKDFSADTFVRFVPKPCEMRPGDNVDISGSAVAAANKYKISGLGIPVRKMGGMDSDIIAYLAANEIASASVVASQRGMFAY